MDQIYFANFNHWLNQSWAHGQKLSVVEYVFL